MWFTRVSIHNPVMATMVMLAFVVLGLFSYQRLSIDQFPNIDIPTVVVQMDYPGASPEIVEAEVTKKVEEAVNTVAGIDTMFSRSLRGQRRWWWCSSSSTSTAAKPPKTCARKWPWSSRCCAKRSRTRASRASIRPASRSSTWRLLSPDGSALCRKT